MLGSAARGTEASKFQWEERTRGRGPHGGEVSRLLGKGRWVAGGGGSPDTVPAESTSQRG